MQARRPQFKEAFSRKNLAAFPSAVLQMAQLAWEAHRGIFVGVILVQALSGLLPISTAWITKQLFDLLALAIQGTVSSDLPRQIVTLLTVQAGLTIAGQTLTSLDRYLNSELSRKLMLK